MNNKVLKVDTAKCDRIYKQLEAEMYKKENEINYSKLIFLVGMVQGFRILGYQVPEIEFACILIKKHMGGVEAWV